MATRQPNGDLEATSSRRKRGRRGWSRRWAALRRAVGADLPTRCAWCGDMVMPWDDWHLDHIVPVTAGGADIRSNVQPLHAACNRAKAASSMPPRTIPAPPSRTW